MLALTLMVQCRLITQSLRKDFRVSFRLTFAHLAAFLQTSNLVVHLTDSTTLTAHIEWHSTRRFRNFLAPYKLKGPVIILTHCCRAAVSTTTVLSISRPPVRPPSSSRYSNNDLYLRATLYGLRHTRTARPLVSPSLGPSWWCISAA